MNAPLPPPSVLARRIRDHLASGGAGTDVLASVRDLVARAEVLFAEARRDQRQAGESQFASTLEAGDMILDMLRGLETALRGPGGTPANLLSFLAFAEKALRAQELGMTRTHDAAPQATRAAARGRALLVEDEEAFLRVAGAWLREGGFEVIEVTRADVARPLLAQEQWDLLFADVVLPGGGDGFDLAAHAIMANLGIAVVFASGFSPRPCPVALRGWPLLQKPFKRADLMAAVDQAMAQVAPAPGPVAGMRPSGGGA